MKHTRVGIERVFLEPDHNLSPEDESNLVDLTMTLRDQDDFHRDLASLGFRAGEGEPGEINDYGELGTIFPIFLISQPLSRDTKPLAKITTFRDNGESFR